MVGFPGLCYCSVRHCPNASGPAADPLITPAAIQEGHPCVCVCGGACVLLYLHGRPHAARCAVQRASAPLFSTVPGTPQVCQGVCPAVHRARRFPAIGPAGFAPSLPAQYGQYGVYCDGFQCCASMNNVLAVASPQRSSSGRRRLKPCFYRLVVASWRCCHACVPFLCPLALRQTEDVPSRAAAASLPPFPPCNLPLACCCM